MDGFVKEVLDKRRDRRRSNGRWGSALPIGCTTIHAETFKEADDEGANIVVWRKGGVCVERRGAFKVDVAVAQRSVAKINDDHVVVAGVGNKSVRRTKRDLVWRSWTKHEVVKVEIAVHELDLVLVEVRQRDADLDENVQENVVWKREMNATKQFVARKESRGGFPQKERG